MILNKRMRVIVAIQIAGAAYAVFTLLSAIPEFDISGITLLLYSILLAVSVLGVASGLFFWMGKTAGYYGSVVTHALQIPMMVTTAMAYKLAFGIGAFLKIIGPIKLVGLKLGASTILIVLPAQQGTIIAVNLYALFALVYLIRDSRKMNEQNNKTTA